jgi:hypothetical protein
MSKLPKAYQDQMDILKARGLSVSDEHRLPENLDNARTIP